MQFALFPAHDHLTFLSLNSTITVIASKDSGAFVFVPFKSTFVPFY
ncbi:hypothetical protein EVA_18700 [gut metagenome]|uniref:Uncharacterized protein n=1 Tax=gut metagenome TaxID=749906 RepID=J9FFI4_9ZZZZ